MFGGGIHKLHSYLNLQDVVFTFLVPSTAHCYRKLVFFFLKEEGKKKTKYLFHSVSPGSHVKGKKPTTQTTNPKSTPTGLDKREAHHTLAN